MSTTQRLVKRSKQEISDAFIEGMFGGSDWSELHALVQEGLERHAFGASTVETFLEHCTDDADVRRVLRGAIVSERSWKRRVADKSPLSAAELHHMTDVGDVVRETRRLYMGHLSAANKFLTRPHLRFGDKPPILVAATEGGAQAVREHLGRMAEGAPV
jgi:putative toxin-antitoxin system antitoxin component (TIGR02293 family)